jgi:hypothetical protein
MSKSTSREWNYNWKCMPHVNTTSSATMCHYVPLLANLVENYSTNIIKGCCQPHSTNGWTSSAN